MGFFGFGNSKTADSALNWVKLNDEAELDQLIQKESFEHPVVLFKHSTRCSISAMALSRLENNWDIDPESAVPVYLDLIRYRPISNKIADDLGIMHQSPQIIIVKDGKATYTSSHNEIDVRSIKQNL